MISKSIIFLISLSCLSVVLGRSFTTVIDTTASMTDEVEVIKTNFPSIVNFLSEANKFDNFVLVPFNDPGVSTPTITSDVHQLVQSINSLSVRGGGDCPEDSLAGIKTALELSRPESYIFLFTDAPAKYSNTFGSIADLCKVTRSKVVIFMSGSGSGAACPAFNNTKENNMEIYYNIAKLCDGTVLKINDINLRKGFIYIKEMIQHDWDETIKYDYVDYGFMEINFSVGCFTEDAIMVISGDYPSVQIIDKDNKSPAVQRILNDRHSLIIRIVDPVVGLYKARISTQDNVHAVVFLKNRPPFDYGFSLRLAKRLKETSSRPIPGSSNYILIMLKENFDIQMSNYIELEIVRTSERKLLQLDQIEGCDRCYSANYLVEPAKSFKIILKGKDPETNKDMTVSTKVIDPQEMGTEKGAKWSPPFAEILEPETNVIEYATSTELACIVKGYPKPSISWISDPEGKSLISKDYNLELPSTFISYVKLENMMSNITVHCTAQNAMGQNSQRLDLFINRPFTFEVITAPQNTTVEYQAEGKLYCKVEAFPQVTTTWYHNDTLIDGYGNIEIVPKENALVIKEMTLADIGTYACKVSNEVRKETFLAIVDISGLEAPEIKVASTDVLMKPGDWENIECKVVKGTPLPQITWSYALDGNMFDSKLPNEVVVNDGKLKIAEVKKEHQGVYRCTATNVIGQKYIDVNVNIRYAPKILIDQEDSLTFNDGDAVALTCEADAIPPATVIWEMRRGAGSISMGPSHTTDESNTHRFTAQVDDVGYYICRAENEVGSDEKSVFVDVLVPPYIEPPTLKNMTVLTGSSISLPCKVMFARPDATTKWLFVPIHSPRVIYPSGNSTNTLYLQKVSKNNEGTYVCVAENEVGNDRIRINVNVEDF